MSHNSSTSLHSTPTALLVQFSSLLISSPQGKAITSTACKTASTGNALLASLWMGGVFLCCWNQLHLPPVSDLCMKSLHPSALLWRQNFFYHFPNIVCLLHFSHMGYPLLPLCCIHFHVQHCWALTAEELRGEQNSKINKYDTWWTNTGFSTWPPLLNKATWREEDLVQVTSQYHMPDFKSIVQNMNIFGFLYRTVKEVFFKQKNTSITL